MLAWRRERGDEVVADVAYFLSTPYPAVRRTPLGVLLRYHAQAARLSRRAVPRGR
jgi:hypothetical protein